MLPYEVALQNRVNQDVLRSLLRQAQELEKADSERKERRYQRRKLVESEEAERVAEEAKAARVTATEEAAAEEAAAEEAAAEEAAGAGGAELDGAEAAADDAATALRSRGGWSARVAYRSPAGRRMSGVLHAAATTGQLSLFRGDGNDAEHAYPVMSTQVSGGCWWCCARESDANDLSLTHSSFLSPLSSSFSLLVSSHLSNYRPNAGLHD